MSDIEYFEGQSAKSNYYHKVTMARMSENSENGEFSVIRGRSPYTFKKINLDQYVTQEDASSTYATKDELDSALEWNYV